MRCEHLFTIFAANICSKICRQVLNDPGRYSARQLSKALNPLVVNRISTMGSRFCSCLRSMKRSAFAITICLPTIRQVLQWEFQGPPLQGFMLRFAGNLHKPSPRAGKSSSKAVRFISTAVGITVTIAAVISTTRKSIPMPKTVRFAAAKRLPFRKLKPFSAKSLPSATIAASALRAATKLSTFTAPPAAASCAPAATRT